MVLVAASNSASTAALSGAASPASVSTDRLCDAIGREVEHANARHAANRVDDRGDDLGAASLADVGNAFDDRHRVGFTTAGSRQLDSWQPWHRRQGGDPVFAASARSSTALAAPLPAACLPLMAVIR